MTMHRARKLSAIVSLAVVAASCGGDATASPETPADASEGKPTPGGTLLYALPAETPDGWCLPEAQLAIAGIQVANTVYDTLTAPDENGVVQPFLAESVEPNDTFDSWTITLREGVKFHDGTDLTAEVVKNNLDAYRGEYPGRSALLLSFVMNNIDSVEATDDLTVTVTTKTPWPAFPEALYFQGRIGILGQSQLDDVDTCDSKLVGTGPFVAESWSPDEQFVATKFADYWQRDADGVQLPYLDGITYIPESSSDLRRVGLDEGTYDAILSQGGSEVNHLRTKEISGDANLTATSDFADVVYVLPNQAQPPFDNINARKAVAQAIDRDRFVDERSGGLDQVASGPFAPGNMGHLEDAGLPKFDVTAAKASSAAYEEETGEPLSFTMQTKNDPVSVREVEIIQKYMADAGIEMEIEEFSQGDQIDKAIAGEFQASYWQQHPGGDPDSQQFWWKSDSPVNFNRFQDDTIDELLEAGRTEPDTAKRTKTYEELNRRLAEQVDSIWIYWSHWAVATQPNVIGMLGPDVDGGDPFPGLANGHPVTGIWVQS